MTVIRQEIFGNAMEYHVLDRQGSRVGSAYVVFASTEVKLFDIHVEPSTRRKGFGSQLIKAVEQDAREREFGLIHVEKFRPEPGSEKAAIEFYLRHGFRQRDGWSKRL